MSKCCNICKEILKKNDYEVYPANLEKSDNPYIYICFSCKNKIICSYEYEVEKNKLIELGLLTE